MFLVSHSEEINRSRSLFKFWVQDMGVLWSLVLFIERLALVECLVESLVKRLVICLLTEKVHELIVVLKLLVIILNIVVVLSEWLSKNAVGFFLSHLVIVRFVKRNLVTNILIVLEILQERMIFVLQIFALLLLGQS